MFSFIVVVYNEEKTVLETLESIKYQVERYGGKKEFQIIIADDKSKDKSREVIDAWLENNQSLFSVIDRLYYEENVGTCKNYVRALRCIKGEAFFSLSGDDIIAQSNIFKKFELLDQYDVVLNSSLKFIDEGDIINNKKDYFMISLQSCMDSNYIRWATKLGNPIMNGAIYKKDLLTDEILEYISEFDLVDDRPRYFKMFQNRRLRVTYNNVPIILYRVSKWSVTSFGGQFSKRHNNDIIKLYDDILQNEKNVALRGMIKWQRACYNLRGRKGILGNFRYLSPYYAKLFWKCLINSRRIFDLSQDMLDNYLDVNASYYKNLKEKAVLEKELF